MNEHARNLDTFSDFGDPIEPTGLPCAECGRDDVPTWDEDALGYPQCNECYYDGTMDMSIRERIQSLPF